jgi:protein ImuA
MTHAGRNVVLSELRQRIEGLERGSRARATLPFGVSDIDEQLPGKGVSLGALHEAFGGGPDLAHTAAAALFITGCLARLEGPVLWCLARRDLFAPALAGAGLHPDRVIYAETGDDALVLPVMEEALRHSGLAGVVAETARLGLTPSRRLQLAAEASGVTAFVLLRWRNPSRPPVQVTAATTRWQLTALPSASLDCPGVGRPRWRVELTRCRGGQAPFEWMVEACDGAGRLRLVAEVADRSAAPAIRRAAG